MESIQINRIQKTNFFSIGCFTYLLFIFFSKIYLTDTTSWIILLINEILILSNFIIFKIMKNKKNYPIFFTFLLFLLIISTSVTEGLYLFAPLIIDFSILMIFSLNNRKIASILVFTIILTNQLIFLKLYNLDLHSGILSSHLMTHFLTALVFFYIKKSQEYLEFLFIKKNIITKKNYINIISNLKAPMSIIKTKIELFLKNDKNDKNDNNNINTIKDTVEVIERNIISVIDIEGSEDLNPKKKPRNINISKLLLEYLDYYKILFDKSDIKLTYNIEENIYFFSERADLIRIFNNIFDYSLSHDYGNIHIQLFSNKHEATFLIEIKKEKNYRSYANDLGFSILHQICKINKIEISIEENQNSDDSISLKFLQSNNASAIPTFVSQEQYTSSLSEKQKDRKYSILIIIKNFELKKVLYEYFSKLYSVKLSYKIENSIEKINNDTDIIITEEIFQQDIHNQLIQKLNNLTIPVIFIVPNTNRGKANPYIIAKYIEDSFSLEEIGAMVKNFILLRNNIEKQILSNVVNKIQKFNNYKFREIERENIDLEHLLTKKEKIIVQKLSIGDSQKIIAYDLGISVNTVKSHIQRIYKKLEVNNVTSLLNKIYFNQTKVL